MRSSTTKEQRQGRSPSSTRSAQPSSRTSTTQRCFCLQGGGRTSLSGNGSGWCEELCYTLNVTDEHGVVVTDEG